VALLEPVGAANLPLGPAHLWRGHTYSRRRIQARVTHPQIGGR
jgi:hypothetical protein